MARPAPRMAPAGAAANELDLGEPEDGAGALNIDFSTPADAAWTPLELPLDTDNLTTVARKMNRLADVVEEGHSVAVFTNMAGAHNRTQNPETEALAEMTPSERKLYNMWRDNPVMAYIDWATSQDEVPTAEGKVAKYSRAALYLNIIYGMDNLTARNAVWFYKNKTSIIPLVVAVERVEKKKNDIKGGQEHLDQMEMAEKQTLALAVRVSTRRVADLMEMLRKTTRTIDAAKQTLLAREDALSRKNPEYRGKKNQQNERRAAMGAPIIGGNMNLRDNVTGGREVRENILRNTGLVAPGARTYANLRAGMEQAPTPTGGQGGPAETAEQRTARLAQVEVDRVETEARVWLETVRARCASATKGAMTRARNAGHTALAIRTSMEAMTAASGEAETVRSWRGVEAETE